MSNLIYYFCHFISIICFFLCYIDSDKKEKEIEGKFEKNELVTLKFKWQNQKFFQENQIKYKKKKEKKNENHARNKCIIS